SGSSSFTEAQTDKTVVYAMRYSIDSFSCFQQGSPSDTLWQSATYAGLYGKNKQRSLIFTFIS
ncbi:MAG: hypothetical protein ACTSYA_09745, partial [Candidatus Kariarchaeaceae archaeon]